jgi:VWFA-related protein
MRKVLAVLLLGSAAAAPIQQPPVEQASQSAPIFRAGARLVEVNVVARDKRGPLMGLTHRDFTLFDDGKPQDIAFFSMRSVRSLPAEHRVSNAPLPDGIVSNRPGWNGDAPATQTVLLLDRLFLPPAGQAYVIPRIRMYLEHRRKRDGIGIYTLGPGLQVVQEVTDNGELLRHAVDRLRAGRPNNRDTDTSGLTGMPPRNT